MKLHCSAILLAFALFSPSFCGSDPVSVKINNKSSEIVDATTLLPPENDHTTTQSPPGTTTTVPTEIVTIPEIATTIPPEPPATTVKPSTTKPPATTTPPPMTTTPSPKTTTTPNSTTSTTTVTPPTSKPTEKPPKPTETPTPLPTASPHKGRQFDGPSFIGGIVLACGLTAIGFVAFKFYKARTERNYHTLSDQVVYWPQEPQLGPYSTSVFLPKTYYS